MAVNLSKGGKISLAKAAADAGIQGGLTKIMVGLGWDTNKYDGGGEFDLDASVFLCGADGKVHKDSDFVFYGSAHKTPDGKPSNENDSVIHTGDNRTGAGDGDDEAINIDLSNIPSDIEKIGVSVTIYDAETRRQNFGMVENAYIRVVDAASGTELIRYDLTEDYSSETAIVVAEIYKHNGEWKFNAIGSGFNEGLLGLCRNYGVNV